MYWDFFEELKRQSWPNGPHNSERALARNKGLILPVRLCWETGPVRHWWRPSRTVYPFVCWSRWEMWAQWGLWIKSRGGMPSQKRKPQCTQRSPTCGSSAPRWWSSKERFWAHERDLVESLLGGGNGGMGGGSTYTNCLLHHKHKQNSFCESHTWRLVSWKALRELNARWALRVFEDEKSNGLDEKSVKRKIAQKKRSTGLI